MSLKETLRSCAEQHKRIVAAAKRGDVELRTITSDAAVWATLAAGAKRVVEGYPHFIQMGWRCRIDGSKIAMAYYVGFGNNDLFDDMKPLGREVVEAFMANLRNVRRDKDLTSRFCLSYRNFVKQSETLKPPSEGDYFDGLVEYLTCACDWHNKGHSMRG
jgi:hypothetical protein